MVSHHFKFKSTAAQRGSERMCVCETRGEERERAMGEERKKGKGAKRKRGRRRAERKSRTARDAR